MSDTSFVTSERILSSERPVGIVRLNFRLFRALPLAMKCLPISIVTIVLASIAPSFFRWYSGKVAGGETSFTAPFGLGEIPLTAVGAIVILSLATFFRVVAWAVFELSGMWASTRLHDRMVRALGRSRTTFFDEHPSGRMINRLVRDYEEVYGSAVIFVGDFLNATVEILSIAVIASFAHPVAGLGILPLIYVFFHIQTQRSILVEHARGFGARATSEVIGRKHDLIEGRETYLLYGKAERLLERMGQSFRKYIQANALSNQVDTWASFWIRVSGELFSYFALIFVVVALGSGWIDAPMAGVIISSLIGITGSIGWLDYASSAVSRSAPHVRRVFEYADLPLETDGERSNAAARGSSTQAPEAAPANAFAPEIVFENYSMSYRSGTPQILDGLTLRFEAGEKTALVGRTGSGKTSIFQALLRMVHVQGGDIRIGGVSAFDLEPRELRRRFGVVPQSPYLFAGSLRSNLDRTGEIARLEGDGRLVESLQAVGLPLALDREIAEGGHNLSLGERQLICLARVIAARKKIVLMDEPTSGLDPETDARVNRVLRDALGDATVITIAHRLESLVHYHRVIELSAGRKVWEGRPEDHPALHSLFK